ncbi:response regulator transcription factor [Paenibacillus sp. alder61]|uniref:Heme response regulator HssR n=1 Tax=Paenibacillus faecis TaxID=862114 RepID=A0A5D0CZC2_9BACL|nr:MULTISPECIES: response regulator transcription factor [Paenibacillus]MCA1296272.1 response regulator transcription factor [Paenibacillus sp. alder61]TYA14217.1 response regulator transcription factor [Paenibacillus faecis]
MAKILIVDDDPHIRELVRVFLEEAGMETEEAIDGLDALRRLEQSKSDLAILDVMMPNLDGWELCRELRRLYEMPVLMLTAKGETRQIVKGFDLGADDYLVKPFQPAELVARVRALLKRYQIIASQSVEIGNLRMNRRTFEAGTADETYHLPLKEFELLFRLGSNSGRTLTREQLIEEIWGYDYEGNERTLDVHINRLREKFPEEKHGFRIRAVRGLGYRLEVNGG